MKKLLFILITVVLFSSHDMYLKLDSFFLQPNADANIQLFNGTFDKSENAIARSRMIDGSLVGNGKRTEVDTTQWSEQDNATILSFTTGEPGTWVAGVSTKARDFKMDAEAFNTYLKHDGIMDMLEAREKNGTLNQDANERYSKHVKTIFQVGETRTDDWQTVLGYPIELVPLSNPYDLHAGDMLTVRLLWQGKPLAGELVYVDAQASAHSHGDDHSHEHGTEAGHSHDDDHSHDHSTEAGHSHDDDHSHDHSTEAGHSHDDDHSHDHSTEAGHSHDDEEEEEEAEDEHHHASATQYRTDAKGEFTFEVATDGIWQVRTIHLVETEEDGLTHESNWATLTFALDHSQEHSHAEAGHSHTDEHEAGIPAFVYWGGSLVLMAGLFFWFNRKD
jgi:uncharacterized GH25 family protein